MGVMRRLDEGGGDQPEVVGNSLVLDMINYPEGY